MKKLITLVLALVMCLSLVACIGGVDTQPAIDAYNELTENYNEFVDYANEDLDSYTQHALEDATSSQAASYVSVKDKSGKVFWGVGIDSDIITSSIKALVSAVNRMLAK